MISCEVKDRRRQQKHLWTFVFNWQYISRRYIWHLTFGYKNKTLFIRSKNKNVKVFKCVLRFNCSEKVILYNSVLLLPTTKERNKERNRKINKIITLYITVNNNAIYNKIDYFGSFKKIKEHVRRQHGFRERIR